ncbi:hypothetical protein [Paenibacillus lutrae]|uniref:Uncharacterized protein n=1 Tax=Paenibacillus lutrae TaxID=2078573 RepID=A0A7X3FLX5_9BACL|nr:hypothetical protein [Paenibacillus lutrae]MVP02143.1 hypothetical protein [Paenibacillus lutrae]
MTIAANMGAQIELEFASDPLYRLLSEKYPKHEIIDHYMANLSDIKEYTTGEFESWYCSDPESDEYLCNKSTMRHWQTETNEYVKAERSGPSKRNFSLGYQSIFRLRMILWLRKYENLKIEKIQELVGIKATLVTENDQKAANQELTEQALKGILSTGLFTMNENGEWALNSQKFAEIVQSVSPPALPGPTEDDLAAIKEELAEKNRQLDKLTEEFQLQKREHEKQNSKMDILHEILELQASIQSQDIELQKEKLSELRRKDPEAYFQAMSQFVKSQRITKKKNIFQRLFTK